MTFRRGGIPGESTGFPSSPRATDTYWKNDVTAVTSRAPAGKDDGGDDGWDGDKGRHCHRPFCDWQHTNERITGE